MNRNILCLLGTLALCIIFTGCASTGSRSGILGASDYSVPVSKPVNRENVVVKVSLKNQAVYVMENGKPLMVTASNVGKPGNDTPKGTYKVTVKQKEKRSGSYGFYVNDSTGQIIPSHVRNRPSGGGWRYVGHPLPYWVQFYPAYGFHVGWIWPVPRTHGCVRLHENVAADFYDIVSIGNTVIIADHLPEDQTIGRNLRRPSDYEAPDPSNEFLVSEKFYSKYISHAESKKRAQ